MSSPGRLATNANGGPLSAAYGGSWQRSGNEGTRSNASDHKRAVILEAERDGERASIANDQLAICILISATRGVS